MLQLVGAYRSPLKILSFGMSLVFKLEMQPKGALLKRNPVIQQDRTMARGCKPACEICSVELAKHKSLFCTSEVF